MSEGANVAHESIKDGEYGEYDDSFREDESKTLSDIDDEDVDLYIHDEKGRQIKKKLWKQQIGSILRSKQPRKQLQQLIRKLLRQILKTVQRIYLQQESSLHLLLKLWQNPERKNS